MVRTVKVRLELDRDDYKQGLHDAAAETRAFDGEVQGLGDSAERTGVEMKGAGESAKKLGDDARTSARDTEAMGTSMRNTGEEVRAAGDKVEAARTRLGELQAALRNVDAELARTKATMAELTSEFARTGDTDLISRITGQKNSASTLSKFRADLEKAKTEAEKAFTFGTSNNSGLLNFALDEWVKNLALKTGEGIEKGLASLGDTVAESPIMSAIVAAAALAAVPVTAIIGSAVGAGIGLAFGGGALAIGIKEAAASPQVSTAWSQFGDSARTALSGATRPFIQPLVDGAKLLGAAFDAEIPHLQSIFQSLAPTVDRLFLGAGGFVREIGPALDKLASFSAPFLSDLADWLPELGAHLASFVDKLVSAGPALRLFFNDLLSFVNQIIDFFGSLIEISARVYAALDSVLFLLQGDLPSAAAAFKAALGSAGEEAQHVTINVQALTRSMQEVNAATQQVGLGARLTKDSFTNLSQTIAQTAQTSDVLAGQMSSRILNSMLSVDQATLGAHQAITALSQAFKENGRQLDINTEKGQANRSAILGAVSANIQHYNALINSGIGAQDAAAAYDADTQSLIRQMRQAGFTRDQIQSLIGKYEAVPDQVNTLIQLEGVQRAIDNLADVMARLGHLDGYVAHSSVVVTTDYVANRQSVYNSQVPKFSNARGGVMAYAAGGIDYGPTHQARSGILAPSDPGTILAGEPSTGGEVFTPRLGIPDERGLALANVAAGWHGGHVVRDTPRASSFGAIQVRSSLTVGTSVGLLPAELMLANWFHNAVLHGQITLKTDDAGIVRVA